MKAFVAGQRIEFRFRHGRKWLAAEYVEAAPSALYGEEHRVRYEGSTYTVPDKRIREPLDSGVELESIYRRLVDLGVSPGQAYDGVRRIHEGGDVEQRRAQEGVER